MRPAERRVQWCQVARGHLDLIHGTEGKEICVKAQGLTDLTETWQRVAGQVLDIDKVQSPCREPAPCTCPLRVLVPADRPQHPRASFADSAPLRRRLRPCVLCMEYHASMPWTSMLRQHGSLMTLDAGHGTSSLSPCLSHMEPRLR